RALSTLVTANLAFRLLLWPLLWRRLRSLDRWQRLDVGRHSGAIVGTKLPRVAHHRPHRAADGIPVRCLPGLEHVGDVILRPIAKSLLSDVGHPVVPLGMRPTGKALAGDDAAGQVAWAV